MSTARKASNAEFDVSTLIELLELARQMAKGVSPSATESQRELLASLATSELCAKRLAAEQNVARRRETRPI